MARRWTDEERDIASNMSLTSRQAGRKIKRTAAAVSTYRSAHGLTAKYQLEHSTVRAAGTGRDMVIAGFDEMISELQDRIGALEEEVASKKNELDEAEIQLGNLYDMKEAL